MSKTGTIPTAGNEVSHQDMANAIRALSMDAVQKAKSGHPGMPMGMADVATVLFTQFLKYNSAVPDWPDRDRFVLSAGHGSMLLYSLLYLTGYPGMDIGQIANFRQLDSKTAGHPEYGHAAGIETTTGPLGQGLANAVGMAIGERLMNARLGDGICEHYTYVIAGDGCLMEGLSHEAISFAGHLGLSKLIVLFDDNGISIDGSTDLTVSDDQPKRFEASGWDTISIDGHDPEAIAAAIAQARSTDRPSLIACRTIIGYGAPNKQGTASTHGAPLGEDEIAAARTELNWPHEPFDIPEKILAAWRVAGAHGASQYAAWDASASQKLTDQERRRLGDPIDDQARSDLSDAIAALKDEWAVDEPKLATRQSSQKVLERLLPVVPCLVGGSADLTGSNGCITAHSKAITPSDFSGNYIHYGVREHGMAAAMNGIALHGGVVPYSGTFLVFSDYCRPSIRLSALMGQRVIYVMTHDSIGLGEDGPTHQPVEHLASLRAIPNVNVFRPADAIECAECWELAIANSSTPAVMALTRQGLPQVRHGMSDENRSAKGAYVLIDPEHRDATILATGSEVSLAVEAAGTLAVEGIEVAVVSMPSWELFRAQPEAYRRSVLGTAPRIAIEAGVASGWHEWLGEAGVYIGMPGFGASAPYLQLYEKFGITSDAIVAAGRAAKAGLS